jgi:ferredoxin-nitrite reductase
MANKGFTGTQKQYLEGLASGLRLAQRTRRAGAAAPESAAARDVQALAPRGPDPSSGGARDRVGPRGERRSFEEPFEERAKRRRPPTELWATISRLAREKRFPEGEDVFLYKFQGLFYVSPVEEAFMCRLRFAAGIVSSYQLRGVAALAERHGHPALQLTTRSNLQLRGIGAPAALEVLQGLADLGIISRGTGADSVRNISANPTAGFDRRELIDTSWLAREAHHRILASRSLLALPRKFTVTFDGGGSVGAMPETADLGFRAVLVAPGAGVTPGVYFRLLLGGATSHARYGRDAGVLVSPEQCIDVIEQVLEIYVEHGDRTNRRRARLSYLIDSWGMQRFVAELQARLGRLWSASSSAAPGGEAAPFAEPGPLLLAAAEDCQLPAPPDASAHIGFHNQKPRGRSYVGVVVPLGQLSLAQARGIADIADEYGSGEVRLTPHQNLIIPGLQDTQLHRVKEALGGLSLTWSASAFRTGLVACTGSAGCQLAVGDTKRRGEELVQKLEAQVQLTTAIEQPLRIHISGCPHSCAQHTIADIGLLATRGAGSDPAAECYQLWLGGQVANDARFAREYARNVPASDVPRVVQGVVFVYVKQRKPRETFREFVGRVSPPELQRWAAEQYVNGLGVAP